MLQLFEYNWQVRKEWLEWCVAVPQAELLRKRTGGAGSILQTLFHIVDSEYSWIGAIEGKADLAPEYEDHSSIERIEQLSLAYNHEIRAFLHGWSQDQESLVVSPSWMVEEAYTAGEILRHVLVHEIHHIGQLSVWSRGLGLNPVSANFIGRGLIPQ